MELQFGCNGVYIYYTLHARKCLNTKSISYSRTACHRVNDTVANYTARSAVLSPTIKYILSIVNDFSNNLPHSNIT